MFNTNKPPPTTKASQNATMGVLEAMEHLTKVEHPLKKSVIKNKLLQKVQYLMERFNSKMEHHYNAGECAFKKTKVAANQQTQHFNATPPKLPTGLLFAGVVIATGLMVQCQPAHAGVKKSFTTGSERGYSKLTTKQIAVMPSRHPLAFFVPNSYRATNSITTIATKAPSNGVSHSLSIGNNANTYDGLIEPNTTPSGNKFSRLFAVVETRHLLSFYSQQVAHLTKQIGGNHA